MKTYHVGIRRGYGPRNNRTLYLEMSRTVDGLSCEILEYLGERCVTKADVKRDLADPTTMVGMLAHFNTVLGRTYSRIVLA